MPLQKKRLVCAVSAVILALLMMLFPFAGIRALAAGEYIATWDAYKESGGAAGTWNDVANAMDDVLEAADALYQSGDATGAHKAVNDAYYGYYETTGFERVAMGYIAGSRKTEVELQFSSCKSVAKSGGSTEDFFAELNKLSEMLHIDANKLDGIGGGGGGMVTFIACLGIIVREGLEAILVVGAIIAYLVKSGNKDKLKYVYFGCILAIAASFLCAWLLSLLKLANSANQEIIEDGIQSRVRSMDKIH